MSDKNYRIANRRYQSEPTPENYYQLWRADQRSGIEKVLLTGDKIIIKKFEDQDLDPKIRGRTFEFIKEDDLPYTGESKDPLDQPTEKLRGCIKAVNANHVFVFVGNLRAYQFAFWNGYQDVVWNRICAIDKGSKPYTVVFHNMWPKRRGGMIDSACTLLEGQAIRRDLKDLGFRYFVNDAFAAQVPEYEDIVYHRPFSPEEYKETIKKVLSEGPGFTLDKQVSDAIIHPQYYGNPLLQPNS